MKSENAKPAKRSRHDAILDSAASQLANFGVGNATLPEIAACMGITRSALYYYASSKEDLVFQVYKRSCDILAEAAEASALLEVPAPDKLAAFITAITDRPYPDVIALNEVGMLEAGQQGVVLARYNQAVDTLAGVIRDGATHGELRSCDAWVAAQVIVSIVQQLCMVRGWENLAASQSPVVDVHYDIAHLAANAIDLVLGGWASDRMRSVPLDLIDLTPLYELPESAFDREGLARAKRAEIVTTASRLFNRRGVSSTTMDDIAAELGATKRTLYHYVGDKQAILAACHARSRQVTRFLLDQRDERLAAGEDLLGAHVNHWRSAALAACDPQLEPLRVAVGLPDLLETERAAYDDFVRLVIAYWHKMHSGLSAAGLLRGHEADTFGQIHIGSINWLAKGLDGVDPADRVHFVTELIDVLRLGLKPL